MQGNAIAKAIVANHEYAFIMSPYKWVSQEVEFGAAHIN